MFLLCCCSKIITSETDYYEKVETLVENSLSCYSGKANSDITGLDACDEAQTKASRDLDGLQSNRGGREGEGDGEDLLGVHH